MTHQEALQHGGASSFPPTDCEGELELLDEFVERSTEGSSLDPDVCRVYRCQLCDQRISMRGETVLNAYRVPSPSYLVPSLADELALNLKPTRAPAPPDDETSARRRAT